MIYITGDMHGDFRRLKRFSRERKLTADDTVIVLGDAGINYFGNSRDEQPRKLIAKLPITVFCIHGNHEMRPETLPIYREQDYRGGIVFVEDAFPNILFAKDGEFYDFDGIETFVCGGAYSVDKDRRIEMGWSWFADEQPSEETKLLCEEKLAEHGWKVDCILTHTTPLKYEPTEFFIETVDQSSVDKSTETWLDSIEDRLDYKRWYCAHYHGSKEIDRVRIMFKDFEIFHI